MSFTCPKCGGHWRTVNRSGVQIEQCTNCRGIFLDPGEMEHLSSAENSFYSGGHAAPPMAHGAPPPASYGHQQPHYGHHGHGHGYAHGHGRGYGHHQKRRKSFFDNLFDD